MDQTIYLLREQIDTKADSDDLTILATRLDAWIQQLATKKKKIETPSEKPPPSPVVTGKKKKSHDDELGMTCHARCKQPTNPAALSLSQSLSRLPKLGAG